MEMLTSTIQALIVIRLGLALQIISTEVMDEEEKALVSTFGHLAHTDARRLFQRIENNISNAENIPSLPFFRAEGIDEHRIRVKQENDERRQAQTQALVDETNDLLARVFTSDGRMENIEVKDGKDLFDLIFKFL